MTQGIDRGCRSKWHMGRVRSGIVLGLAAVVVGLVMVPSASARQGHGQVDMRDQHGYQMSIEASRNPLRVVRVAGRAVAGPNQPAPLKALSRRHAVAAAGAAKVSESKPRANSGFLSVQVENRHAVSTYGVQGTVTHKRLFGKLGDRGRISLHFHLHRSRTQHRGCRSTHERIGTFTGRVVFHGENGYVDVNAQRLHGMVEIPGRGSRCRFVDIVPAPRHHKANAKREAGRHELDRYSILYANREGESADTDFASIKETREYSVFYAAKFARRGPVLIDRESYRRGKAGDFKVNKRVTRARLEPSPNAYRGVGRFHGRHDWTGSLKTSFPGAPSVGLAGNAFSARLDQIDFGR